MQNTNMRNKIILLDSIYSIDDIKKELTEFKDVRIITFDYNSHKNLLKNKIKHEISDDFLHEDDRQLIQNESFILANWHNGELRNLLKYENVNLGKTFYVEFHHYLLQILKKIIEIKNIIEEESNVEFIVSPGLFKITNEFHSSVLQLNTKIKNNDEFLDDSIKFHLTNSVKFDLSRKSYQRLKKSSEKIFSSMRSKDMRDGERSILFVEFDPIKYEKLFENSKHYSLNFILFNRRRPSMWNLKSYQVIKNSNCIIANANNIMDEKLSRIIENEQEKISKEIKNLWNNEEFFKTYFKIKNKSFWEIIKIDFQKLCINRMKDAINEIHITKKILERFKISSIVCWSENGFNEQIVIGLGQKMKKRIFLLQHGLYADSIDSVSQNEFSGVLPKDSDNFLVWGDVFKQYTEMAGISDSKIEIIGSPSYDSILDEREIIDNRGKHILIATTSTSNKIGDFLINNRQNFERIILSICKILEKQEKEIIIKIHPFEEEEHITELVKKFNSKIKIIKKGDIIPLIKACDVFITLDMSTTILEAQLLKKPVISINTETVPFNDGSTVFESDSCVRIKIDEFEETIHRIFHDNDYRIKLIRRGTDYLNRYVSNQGNASIELLSYLEKF